MDMTQTDYEERKQRVADGEGTDEDRRLVKHYEREQAKQADNTPSWLLHEQPDEEDGDPAAGYDALSKRQLVTELGKRKNDSGRPLSFPNTANKATLISLLQENDRQAAERTEQVD